MITAEPAVTDPWLREAYRRCRKLNARHGRTYYLATRMLTRAQRPAVHALYGFARMADDVVDDVPPGTPPDQVAARLDRLRTGLRADEIRRPRASRRRRRHQSPSSRREVKRHLVQRPKLKRARSRDKTRNR